MMGYLTFGIDLRYTGSVPNGGVQKIMDYKVKRVVTVPVFSLKEVGSEYAIQVSNAMYIADPMEGDTKEPPTILDCVNLETGELGQIVCPKILSSRLESTYPNDTYVGLCFLVKNLGKREGKPYNDIYLAEIEAPTSKSK